MSKTKKVTDKGFTIIEVLIVLAIAAVILLLVFLAVPALQRNSRNTQRKNDVQNMAGALQEYENNHAGQLPTDTSWLGNTKLGFYNPSTDIVYNVNSSQYSTAPSDNSKVTVETYAKCKSDNSGFDSTAGVASSRNVAAVFFVETTSAPVAQCVDM